MKIEMSVLDRNSRLSMMNGDEEDNMKVLYLCNYYHRAMIFRDAMNQLEKRGHSLLAFNSVEVNEKIDAKYESIMDDKVIHVECYEHRDRYIYFWKQFKIYRELLKNVNCQQYDIIHCHTLFNGGWVARRIKREFGVPYVVSVRNTDINDYLRIPLFIPIARKIALDAGRIMFLSKKYRDHFLNICFSAKERVLIEKKCEVIYNGLESFWLDNKYQKKHNYHDPLRLICVGKIDYNKNMKTVVETVKVLKRRNILSNLTVVGQVVDESIMRELEVNSDLVEIIPFLPKEELIKYYRNSDVFVMPSHFESFGRVYAEAMTQGLPVIYTRGQGFDGIFDDGHVGYSVEATNADEIADAIEKIIHNYTDISRHCIECVNIFNWESIAVQLEKMYFEVLR